MFRFISRAEGLKNTFAIDVSSYSKEVFGAMSPFSMYQAGIPVPGLPTRSYCVEGIWQGLKLIGGRTDSRYFVGPGRKRRPDGVNKLDGWWFKGQVVDVVTARHLIYVPAYLFFWKYAVQEHIKVRLQEMGALGQTIYLYDFGANGDINNPTASYSHASLICDLMNERLAILKG